MKRKRDFVSILCIVLAVLLLLPNSSLISVKATPAPTLADLQELYDEAAAKDKNYYTAESYAPLAAALTHAKSVLDAGREDGDSFDAVTGKATDSKWEVLNPKSIDSSLSTYTSQANQTSVFGGKYISFYDEDSSVRATYETSACTKYGDGLFGSIKFRYNRSSNPITVDFNNDTLTMNFDSTIVPAKTVNKNFAVDLKFAGISQTLRLSLLNSNNSGWIGGGLYEAVIELKNFKDLAWAGDWKTILAANNNILKLEYIYFSQNIQYNGDPGISFIINDFIVAHKGTGVADSTVELQAALDGLVVSYDGRRLEELRELYAQWKDIPQGYYTDDTYADLKEALENAKSAIQIGKADGSSEIQITGNAADSNWEVKNPNSMASGYTSQSAQTEAFGKNYINFYQDSSTIVRATYDTAARGKYGDGNFGGINFRYNCSASPVTLNYNDVLHVDLESTLLPGRNAIYPMQAELYFKDCPRTLQVSLMTSGGIDWIKGGYYLSSVPLYAMIENSSDRNIWMQYLSQNDYQLQLESIVFSQNIWWNGDAGISFMINDFSVSHYSSDVYNAYFNLQMAIDSLVEYIPDVKLSQLKKLYDDWKSTEKDDYTNKTYNAFKTALDNAKAALNNGLEDGISTYPVVGGVDDPHWEVRNPISMESGFTPQSEQTAVFGEKYISFYDQPGGILRATYETSALNKYSGGCYGNLSFRYNYGNKMPSLNLKTDSIDTFFVSTILPGYNADYYYNMYLNFEGIAEPLHLSRLVNEDYEWLYAGINSERDFAHYLDSEWATKWESVLKEKDYKLKVKSIDFCQLLYWNADAGISYIINRFNITHTRTDVSDAYSELMNTSSKLKTYSSDSDYSSLRELYNKYKDAEKGSSTDGRYQILKAALDNAKKVLDEGTLDGEIKTGLLVGDEKDSNWQIKNPNSLEAGYTSQNKQTEKFGDTYLTLKKFSDSETIATYEKEAFGKYGPENMFGSVNFRYSLEDKPQVINFNTDTLKIDLTSAIAPSFDIKKPIDVSLCFEGIEQSLPISALNNTELDEGYIKSGIFSATINLKDYANSTYIKDEWKAILIKNDYKLKLKSIVFYQNIYWNGDEGTSIIIKDFTLTHVNTYVYDAKKILLEAVEALSLPDRISLLGNAEDKRWEVKNPTGMKSGYTSQADQQTAFGNKHITFVNEYGTLRATYETDAAGKYGEGLFGGIDFRFNYGEEPMAVNFNEDILYLNLKSKLLNTDITYPFYIDLYFVGIVKPLRLSLLNSENADYTQDGSLNVQIKLSNFLNANWNTGDYNTLIKAKGGIVQMQSIVFHQDIQWKGNGGISFIIEDFSLLHRVIPNEYFFNKAMEALSAKTVTLADRYEVNEAKKLYDKLSDIEKANVSSDYKKLLNSYLSLIDKSEKEAYMFPVFDNPDGWVTNNATDPEKLMETFGPLNESTAYLNMSGGNGSLVLTPTGNSVKYKACWAGAAIGWNYVKYTYKTKTMIDLTKANIYYDIKSDVNTQVLIYLNEGDDALSVPLGEKKPAGVYSGVINVAELIQSSSDAVKKKLGIKNKKKAFITSLSIMYENVGLGDFDYTKEVNIRTLALSNAEYSMAGSKTVVNPGTGNGAGKFPVGSVLLFAIAAVMLCSSRRRKKVKSL